MKHNLILAIFTFAILFACRTYSQETDIDNVVIVLDASGSMNEGMRDAQGKEVKKIDAAKAALYEVLNQVPDTTHIGLFVFSSTRGSGVWFYDLGPKDDAKLKQAINSIQPSGGTPLGTYMKVGADRLLKEREKQFNYGSYRLLVVTDGEANNERPNLVDDYTKEIMSRGITLDAIGVSMANKHTLATKVHSYRSAKDPESFTRAVREVFAEISSEKNDVAGEDAFALIAGIPTEVAAGMISALSNTGNNPIGERSAQPIVGQVQRPQNPPVRNVIPPQVQTQSHRRNAPMAFMKVVISVFIIIFILAGVIKMSSNS
ncbi:MAG: VWA domain-containing protein [Sedimentisphaerales bacterium]|nr:VWA domain-containing protein [Sedimentisphaerales bacterium]